MEAIEEERRNQYKREFSAFLEDEVRAMSL